MQACLYRFVLGALECVAINDGFHRYRLEELFVNIPKSQVEAALRQDRLPTGYVETPYTCLYIKTGQRHMLVDAGAGAMTPHTGLLLRHMRGAGIAPESIDTVIITHAHPDHIGGILDCEGKPVFPNAEYYIWKDEWDFWASDKAEKKTSPGFIAVARQYLMPIKDRMHFIDQEMEIAPGVVTIPAPGHTPGHIVLSVCSGNAQLIHVSDTVLHPMHLGHPDWLPIFDILPQEAAATKQRIFDWVAEAHALVFAHHFPPFPNLGYVTRQSKGWRWEPSEVVSETKPLSLGLSLRRA